MENTVKKMGYMNWSSFSSVLRAHYLCGKALLTWKCLSFLSLCAYLVLVPSPCCAQKDLCEMSVQKLLLLILADALLWILTLVLCRDIAPFIWIFLSKLSINIVSLFFMFANLKLSMIDISIISISISLSLSLSLSFSFFNWIFFLFPHILFSGENQVQQSSNMLYISGTFLGPGEPLPRKPSLSMGGLHVCHQE